MFYKNQKEDQETSAGLRQAEESSDSETEDVAELKSLSDSDTDRVPDIPLDDAVERRTLFGRTRRFFRNIWTFLHEVFK